MGYLEARSVTARGKLKLNLLENAYDYLNASLEYVVRARRDKSQVAWKFALLNISFAIELMLKERLRRAHELLIYADLDRYRPITREPKTVSWTVLVERIKYVLGEDFARIDAGRLNLAQRLRNQMLHYDVVLDFPAVYHDFANLLNFFRGFYNEEIRTSDEETLHDHVNRELWSEEEDLSQAFLHEIIYFNGIFMPTWLKTEIEEEQYRTHLLIEGTQYARLRYGSPEEYLAVGVSGDYATRLCHDCSVAKGQIHLEGCDMEICPRCKGQLITCGCQYVAATDTASQ